MSERNKSVSKHVHSSSGRYRKGFSNGLLVLTITMSFCKFEVSLFSWIEVNQIIRCNGRCMS